MNKKGFTLVELLAVLVILAIVLGITIVSVSGIFNNAKKKSEDAFVATIKDAMEMYLTSEDAKGLSFSTTCSNVLSKSYGNRKVYKSTITFANVINSEYKPITQADLVNPANKDVACNNASSISVTIYRDEDYVYYYKINRSAFGCLLNAATGDASSVITNLPEGFSC